MRAARRARWLCAVALLLAGALGPAAAQEIDAAPTLTLTGEGVASAPSDMATLRLGVETREPTADLALEANNAAMRAVLDTLKTGGIPARDLQTAGLSVYPISERYDRDGPDGAPRIVGYQVSNGVVAVVRDLATLGTLLDTAFRAGANRFDGLSFGVADPEPLRREARVAAVADARAAAETYAEAAGVTLGPILRIEETGERSVGPRPEMRALAKDSASSVPTEGGESAVTQRVTIRWRLTAPD